MDNLLAKINLTTLFRKIINTKLNYCFITLMLMLIFSKTFAQSRDPSPINFPVPKNIENMLFYLQRDPNTNTLIYAANLDKNGNIIKSNPVKVYWLRYAEKGEKKELGYIQRKFAYGIDAKEITKDKYELRFVSHKKLPLYLKKYSDKSYCVSVTVNNKTIRLTRLFVRIEGGTFWLPNVKYAEVEGIEESSGKQMVERISLK